MIAKQNEAGNDPDNPANRTALRVQQRQPLGGKQCRHRILCSVNV